MSKQLLSIDWFKEAIVNDETTQWNKGFVDMLWLDPWAEDWVLQINKRLIADTTVWLSENPYSNTTFDWKTLYWMDSKEIWYENTTDTWTLLHTNSNAWDNVDLITYQDYLIYAANTKLWRSTNTTIAWGFTDNPTWWSGTVFTNGVWNHYFKVFNNRLYITDWNFLSELDGASDPATPTNWIFTAEKFTLPKWEVIQTLEVIWWQLALWTQQGNFYLWDWASANASQIIKTQLWGITAMIQVENTLFVFAWVSWTVYRYNGADLVPAIQIPRFNIGSTAYVYKTGVRRYKNWFIFWISKNWIYVYNRVKEWESFSLNKYGNLSWWRVIDEFDWTIYSLYVIDQSSSDDRFLVWYLHWTRWIDKPSETDRYRMEEAWSNDTTAAPFFETFVYELRDNNWKPNKVQWLQWLFKDDWANVNNNIKVEYRLENNTSYTVLWSIWEDGIDANKILRWIWKRVAKMQFRVKFWRESNSISWVQNTKLIQAKIF